MSERAPYLEQRPVLVERAAGEPARGVRADDQLHARNVAVRKRRRALGSALKLAHELNATVRVVVARLAAAQNPRRAPGLVDRKCADLAGTPRLAGQPEKHERGERGRALPFELSATLFGKRRKIFVGRHAKPS